MKSKKRVVAFNMDEEIINEIDKQRGDVNRSLYLNKLLLKLLKGGIKNENN